LIDGEYVERPEEQAVIARMRERRQPPAKRTFRDIAEVLTSEGIAPPSGEVWFANTVSRILKRAERRAVAIRA
jgi:Recombinase